MAVLMILWLRLTQHTYLNFQATCVSYVIISAEYAEFARLGRHIRQILKMSNEGV